MPASETSLMVREPHLRREMYRGIRWGPLSPCNFYSESELRTNRPRRRHRATSSDAASKGLYKDTEHRGTAQPLHQAKLRSLPQSGTKPLHDLHGMDCAGIPKLLSRNTDAHSHHWLTTTFMYVNRHAGGRHAPLACSS